MERRGQPRRSAFCASCRAVGRLVPPVQRRAGMKTSFLILGLLASALAGCDTTVSGGAGGGDEEGGGGGSVDEGEGGGEGEGEDGESGGGGEAPGTSWPLECDDAS